MRHERAEWARTRQALLPSIHEIDRNATHIWFHFFPLGLAVMPFGNSLM
jgi:hypothetical protein